MAMSETYIGWDGESYPWPPPEGWYEASDGRWWAPGTGPGSASGAGFEGDPFQGVTPGAGPPAEAASFDPGATAPYTPSFEQQQQPGQVPPPRQDPVAPQNHPQPGATAAELAGRTARLSTDDMPPGVTHSAPAASAAGAAATTERRSADGGQAAAWERSAPAASGRSGLAKVGLVLVGVVVALAVAGVAYAALQRDGADDDLATGDETTAPDATDDAASTTEDITGSAGTGDGGADADDTTTTDGSTTTDDPSTTGDGSSTTADASAQVADFREILADNGLTSEELSDGDISTFGSAFCVFAVAAENEGEYVTFRDEATADADSDLSDDELAVVIDAAVVVFCPEEASRLGIDL